MTLRRAAEAVVFALAGLMLGVYLAATAGWPWWTALVFAVAGPLVAARS